MPKLNLLTSVEVLEPGFLEQANTWITSNAPLLIAGSVVVVIVLVGLSIKFRAKHPRKSFYR